MKRAAQSNSKAAVKPAEVQGSAEVSQPKPKKPRVAKAQTVQTEAAQAQDVGKTRKPSTSKPSPSKPSARRAAKAPVTPPVEAAERPAQTRRSSKVNASSKTTQRRRTVRTLGVTTLSTLTAALIGGAAAQQISTSLPMTSVGDKLMWTVGDQDLRLVVGQAGRVQLDVYGAQFDPQDYRRPADQGGEYGDEGYGTEVSSTFLLLDAQGRVVHSQTFGTGGQDWQTFLNDDLAAGTYTLRVQTSGQGKNTFALRLNTISAAVEADRLNVNVHAHAWIPALNVVSTGGDQELHLYDGDGPGELEAQLRDAQGHVYPFKMPLGRNLGLDVLPLPTAAGTYTLFLRQPAGAKQYSNTVAFSLQRGGEQAPLTVVRSDSAGLLEVSAELVLPGGNVPASAEVSLGERQLSVNGVSDLSLPPSSYPVMVQPTPGASTTVSATQITSRGVVSSVSSPRAESVARVSVPRGGLAQVRVQVRPEVALNFVADKTQVCVGDVVMFTATASTAYARQMLPADLRVSLPAGFEASGTTQIQAQLDAAHPAQLRFEARATAAAPAGPVQVAAILGPWDKSQTLGIKVQPDVAQIELRRAGVPSALPGEVVTVRLSLHNSSGVAAPYRLVDAPGENLTPIDPVVFGGELAAGESRTLSYRARVGSVGSSDLKATLSSNCGVAQQVSAPFVAAAPPVPVPQAPQPEVVTPVQAESTQAQPAPAAPAPVLVVSRTSAVRIPFDAPRSATQLMVAHTPPAGASYVPGSSVLNGKPLADPLIGPSGRLYWTTPGAPRGVLGYSLRHQQALPALETPALLGRYALGRQEVLVGQIDPADLKAAVLPGQAAASENAGAVRLPLDGTVFRERDRVTVAVQNPGAVPAAGENLPTINGHSIDASALGQTTLDPQAGSVRREFYGVQLRPGENTIGFGSESVRVYLAGTPVTAELTPVQLVADGVQPIALKIKLLDINGLTPGTPTVTIESSLDPLTPDARPLVASQQLKLQNGEGLLELPPISAPTRFTVRVLVGSGVISRSFEAAPSSTRVGVGSVSLTGSLGSGGSGLAYEGRSQGYLETPLGAGKLYVAGSGALRGGAGQVSESVKPDGTVVSTPTVAPSLVPTADPSQGLLSTANPLLRFPGYGDSSSEQLPLQGADPLAFRYEHPAFSVSYRQAALPIDVFSIGGNVTALSGFTRSAAQVSGFVAALPGGSVTETLPSNGTRIYKLGSSDVSPDSQSVDLVSTDAQTGAQTLTRLISGSDYSLDPVAGVLYFSRPLPLLDTLGNAQSLRVVYRVLGPGGNRQLAFGAQVSTHIGQALTVGAAAVRLDGVTNVGVRARYDSEAGVGGTASRGRQLTGDVLAAYAGGVMLDGTLSGKDDRVDYTASLRYQDPGYVGLNAPGKGVAAAASLDARISGPFGVRLAAQYSDGSYQLGHSAAQEVSAAQVAGGSQAAGTQGGLISVLGRYQFSTPTLGTVRLGAGVQAGFGVQRGLSALGSLGYTAGPLDLSVDHSQPLGDSTQATTTTAAVKVQLAQNVTLIVRDVIDWGGQGADGGSRPISQQASVGFQGKLGGTNLSAGYELPNASGSGNRARFGVDTALPLNEHFTVNLSGGTLYTLGSQSLDFNAGTSLRYKSAQLSGSAGADVASTAGVFRTVLKAGLSYAVNDQWSLTLDAARALGPADQTGTNLSASAALRAGVWQGLAYVRYQDGALGGAAPQLIGEADLEYHQARLGLRAGVAARMLVNDPASLTIQPSVSGRYYLNDLLAVGIAGRAIYQPSSNYSAYSLGLEGSLRALPGTWVTLGYNPLGFDGISGNVSTRRGLYLRLDLLLDEAATSDAPKDK